MKCFYTSEKFQRYRYELICNFAKNIRAENVSFGVMIIKMSRLYSSGALVIIN